MKCTLKTGPYILSGTIEDQAMANALELHLGWLLGRAKSFSEQEVDKAEASLEARDNLIEVLQAAGLTTKVAR